MKIKSNQYSFGNTYKIKSKDKDQADRLDLILNTAYFVERGENSKNLVIIPRRQYNEYIKVAEDISNTIYPQKTCARYLDEDLANFEYDKLKAGLIGQILEQEKKNAIDIKI